MKMKPVAKDQIAVSTGLIQLVKRMRFLRAFMRVFTLMKRAPRRPPRTPITIETGMMTYEFPYVSSESWLPNLMVEPLNPSVTLPLARVCRMANTSTATEQQVNVRQTISKVQKTVGFDISYANSVPPIGAPKAALTPADAPAAMIYLLNSSFWRNSKPRPGK